jgi:RimJ/RimL family protein N-acetyltransferase
MILQYQASEYSVYDHQWPTSEDELQAIARSFAEGDRFLAVWLKESPALIGFVALNPSGDNPTVFDLGYVFNFDYHGCGYAVEACRELLNHAFESRGATQITTGTAAANEPSCRLLEALGMKKTAERKASFQRDDRTEQVEFTALSFALTREEWQAKSRPNDRIHHDNDGAGDHRCG